jgi:hypothetical protein
MRTKYQALVEYLKSQYVSKTGLPVEGCTDAEIDEIRRHQQVERFPQLYVEWLKTFGKTNVFAGVKLTYPHVLDYKQRSFLELQQSNIFVLAHDWDGDCAIYCRIDEDDPMLYWIGYDSASKSFELVVEDWEQLSTWLVGIVDDLLPVSD